MDRYFIGKFGKDENVVKLTELNKSFVLFALEEGEDEVTAIFSNTDVRKGETWALEDEHVMPATKFIARSKKRK